VEYENKIARETFGRRPIATSPSQRPACPARARTIEHEKSERGKIPNSALGEEQTGAPPLEIVIVNQAAEPRCLEK
jgi:hypothetical protein